VFIKEILTPMYIKINKTECFALGYIIGNGILKLILIFAVFSRDLGRERSLFYQKMKKIEKKQLTFL
jgi:uncharacterized membrane protein